MSKSARVAVVTGAGGGIGAAVASRLLDRGFDVVSVDLAFPDGARGRLVVADIGEETAAASIAAAAGPRVDVLVNAAAIRPAGPLADFTRSEWIRCLEVNLLGVASLLSALEPYLVDGRAVVMNVASGAAFGKSRLSAYGASKAGLISLSRTAALELSARGIRVNVIIPGTTETGMLRDARGTGTGTPDQNASRNFTGRVLSPSEVADAIVAAIEVPLMTGAVLPVGLQPWEW
jgi:2,3-dihydro-2,3-dihydroxybenzoate dehydrogenase